MDKEQAYEYIEESGAAEIMELLDAVVNRFRELHADWELVVLTLPARPGPDRERALQRSIELLLKYEQGTGAF